MDPGSRIPAGDSQRGPAAGSLLEAAVHNNAVWCDTVCLAQGAETAWVDGLWVNHHPAPPYYSNAVTTSPLDTMHQLDRLGRMLASTLPRPWTVKDGYHGLDLAPLGFHVLFEAQWIQLPVGPRMEDGGREPAHGADDLEWSVVTSPAALEDWETCWRGENPEAATSGPPVMFRPVLLDDADIRFLAGRRSGRTLAVVAANRSDDGTGPAVGISNLVLCDGDRSRSRAGAVDAVRHAFPGLPMVGYERGDDLAAMRTLGFQPSGPLRVWITDD